ncbi:MAG: DPP IV N-terminal domain-containing protein [Chloroflexi bacterium]|nr:DPP IV N-terminal domain-containing protein [Chloroflexota bacterium]
MADELQLEELDELGAAPESRWKRLRHPFRRLQSLIARIWNPFARALAWLRRPDEVGQPLTLQPRGVRLLVLLVLGNMAILALLTVALYQATSIKPGIALLQPTVAAANPAPSPLSEPTPAAPDGLSGAIAFTLRRDGNADIYALNQTDRQLVRLTYDSTEDRDPAWSPDGNYIAFTSNRAHNWDVYLLDLVSGNWLRLTHDPGFDANPSWSPDGEYIAFESYRQNNLDIHVMNTSTGKTERITTDRAPDYEPAWSPNGRAIAFTSFREGSKDIYLYLVEEEKTINVTNSPDLDEDDPAWSPDGTQLAYVSGPRSNPYVQVTTFDWDALAADQAQTELFGAGTSPAWAPDGQSLVYAYERGQRSHLIAASMTGWALFHEVYSTAGPLDDLAWTSLALSPRIVARAYADTPATAPPLYVELVQPTPVAGPPYKLVALPSVTISEEEDENEVESAALLSDRVNESFNALRQRVIEEAGWDYMANLGLAQLPMTYTPYSGHSRMSWLVCGRAIGLDQEPYSDSQSQIELVREDVGNVTYWRVFIRAAEQDGSMGEPLREAVWNLNARQEEGRAMVEGGELAERIPSGYYVDFTTLAGDHGWERMPSLWRWRYFWPDIRWWRFQKTDDLTWWECMLEIFEPNEIEDAFGPIPEYED